MSVVYIPSHDDFAAQCAHFLLESKDVLTKTCVFLPSRRAKRAMKEALLKANEGKPLLLPRLYALGDADLEILIPETFYSEETTLPPVISETARLLRLARLIEEKAQKEKGDITAEKALHLAKSFAALSDDFTREQISLAALEKLVPDDVAEHWQKSLAVLATIVSTWPKILAEERRVDTWTRRNMEIELLATCWRKAPPDFPIVVAGTTGSIPATAHFMETIAGMKTGLVILPGLDTVMPEKEWDALLPTHPQFGMKQLLGAIKVERASIPPLKPLKNTERMDFLRHVLKPAEFTDSWKHATLDWQRALQGMTLIHCQDEHEEAGVITLILRQVLEEEGHTAMLVTHDRLLARQVSSMMRRYGVEIDDSAGVPLTSTPLFVFLSHIIDYAFSDGNPIALLALLKHPLARLSREAIEVREAARHIEEYCLRGVRNWNSIQELEGVVKGCDGISDEAKDVLMALHRALEPLFDMLSQARLDLAQILDMHCRVAEEIALPQPLDASDSGRKILRCIEKIASEGQYFSAITPSEYPALLKALLATEVYRKPYDTHPRLRILSPLEARLQHADTVILGGLNEGNWPPAPAIDPWLSLPMREQAGLKSHGYEIGQSAHDFWMLAQAPRIFLTRAVKQRNSPSVTSRWLLRLETVLEAADKKTRDAFIHSGDIWKRWYQAHCATEAIPNATRPDPAPPLAVRPTKIPVSRIKTLLEDPYSFYAERVLRLEVLKPLDQLPDGRDFGDAIHAALERFFTEYPQLPAHAESIVFTYMKEEVDKKLARSRTTLFWEQRLRGIAQHIAELVESGEKPTLLELERTIEWSIINIILHGRIDRLEHYADGSSGVIDYKTSKTPLRLSDIVSMKDPQMGLLGMLLTKRGQTKLRSLAIWPLTGKESTEGDVHLDDAEKITSLLAETEAGVYALLTEYAKRETSYPSLSDHEERDKPYDHLARVGEWS
ncbi:MAG: double-strand break repair protein AddB [Rickettsiales bacterium]